jgi:acetyltransferase-like isoleucine patch superfamily enzyme
MGHLKNFYVVRIIKHVIKKLLCLSHGIRRSGTNVYLSPRAKIRGGKGIRLESDVVVESFAELIVDSPDSRIDIGYITYLHSYCQVKTFKGWIKIGSYCTVNRFAILAGHGGLEIGNNVLISPNVIINPQNHIFDNPNIPIWKQGISKEGIRIEDDVWIGAGAIILDGVTISRGSIIGAGAVVTKNISAYSVAVGVPARVIKKRGVK